MRSSLLQRAAAIAVSGLALMPASGMARDLVWGEHLPECCSMYSEALKWMAAEVSKRSGGDLTLNVNWGGVLASVGEVPTAVEASVIDMGNVVTPYFPDQFIINNALAFFWPQPKGSAELGEMMLNWHETYPEFDEELARYNLRLVSVRPLPPYGVLCTSPIRSLEDFRGKRIRTPGAALPAMAEALGAVAVGMADVATYEALANNVLDCTVSDVPLVDAFHLEEVAKYFIDVPIGASFGHILVINRQTYEGLSDREKAVLDSIKEDHLAELLRLFAEAEVAVRKKWKDQELVEIIELPGDEFLGVVLAYPAVQAIRQEWKTRAVRAGMAAADADAVVSDITR